MSCASSNIIGHIFVIFQALRIWGTVRLCPYIKDLAVKCCVWNSTQFYKFKSIKLVEYVSFKCNLAIKISSNILVKFRIIDPVQINNYKIKQDIKLFACNPCIRNLAAQQSTTTPSKTQSNP